MGCDEVADAADERLEVAIRSPDGMGMVLRGMVSCRYICSEHCRLVSLFSGSYRRRSRIQ